MSIAQRLDLRQSQQLVMTPQLQQAIRLLQMSHQELTAFVAEELERNPLLEAAGSDAAKTATTTGDDTAERLAENSAERIAQDSLPGNQDAPLDADYSNEFEGDRSGGEPESIEGSYAGARDSLPNGSAVAAEGLPDGLAQLSSSPSLRDFLLEQIAVEFPQARERIIALAFLSQLDDAGYLAAPLTEIADTLSCDHAIAESILERLQRFEPTGIFARNLSECLALQLRELDRLDPAMQIFLDNLPMLADQRLGSLARRCGVDREDLADMIDEIRRLDPKPAARFEASTAQTVIPDVLMRPSPKGGWILELNPDALPRVLINQRFVRHVTQSARSKADKEYLTTQLSHANWLVRALEQRANTMLKVSAEIVRRQKAFFEKGVAGMVPLTLREIAGQIEMHESTVSRVTVNKYIATPRGTFELRYFFTQALSASDGDGSHAAEAVRDRIRDLISKETVESVLSDDRLVELLDGEGVAIARRTVAKYREAMSIPSSAKRRRQMRAALAGR